MILSKSLEECMMEHGIGFIRLFLTTFLPLSSGHKIDICAYAYLYVDNIEIELNCQGRGVDGLLWLLMKNQC